MGLGDVRARFVRADLKDWDFAGGVDFGGVPCVRRCRVSTMPQKPMKAVGDRGKEMAEWGAQESGRRTGRLVLEVNLDAVNFGVDLVQSEVPTLSPGAVGEQSEGARRSVSSER